MRKKTPMIPGLWSKHPEDREQANAFCGGKQSLWSSELEDVQCASFIGIRLETNHPTRSQGRLKWVNQITLPCNGRLQFAAHFLSLSLLVKVVLKLVSKQLLWPDQLLSKPLTLSEWKKRRPETCWSKWELWELIKTYSTIFEHPLASYFGVHLFCCMCWLCLNHILGYSGRIT